MMESLLALCSLGSGPCRVAARAQWRWLAPRPPTATVAPPHGRRDHAPAARTDPPAGAHASPRRPPSAAQRRRAPVAAVEVPPVLLGAAHAFRGVADLPDDHGRPESRRH